jgi:hypothetical protein
MAPTTQQDSRRDGVTVGISPVPPRAILRAPQCLQKLESPRAPEKVAAEKQTEAKPSHFAPENPTSCELAKERWYTRAAWASIAIGYSAALFAIKYGDGPAASPSDARALCVDTLFCYWALKNSELRRFILEGSALPNPNHGDLTIRMLLAAGGLFYFLGSFTNSAYAASLFLQGDYGGGTVRTASALTTLHLGAAWLRRARFFGRIHSQ